MKKFWDKYKVLIIIVLAVLAFVALSFLSENKEPAQVSENITTWKEIINSDEYVITVIGLTYCPACKSYHPIISDIAEEYSLPLYWFDIDEMSNDDSSQLTNTYNFSQYTGSSPYTVITSGGEVIDEVVGAMDEEETLEFLRTNGVID